MSVQKIETHEDLACLTEADLIRVNGSLAVFLADETKASRGLTFLTKVVRHGQGACLEVLSLDGATEIKEGGLYAIPRESITFSAPLANYPIEERKLYMEIARKAGL